MPVKTAKQNSIIHKIKSIKFYIKKEANIKQEAIEFIAERIQKSKVSRDRSAIFKVEEENLFIKSSLLRGFRAKLRATFKLKRSSFQYDAPLESLKNTLLADEIVPAPRILGFGVDSKFGLLNKIIIIQENLSEYVDGLEWLERNPEQAESFIRKILQEAFRMHHNNHYHLDLWLRNVMLDKAGSIKFIDFEQYYIGQPRNTSIAMGFISGYLYFNQANRFIPEDKFDNIIQEILSTEPEINEKDFNHAYLNAKSNKTTRAQKVKIFYDSKALRAGTPLT